MNNDKVVLVDEDDNILGEVSRLEAHQNNLNHRIAVVYLANEKGQILIQVRDDGRLDHSSAGHVDPGESYIEAAKRELEEELGVNNVVLKKIGHTQSVNVKYRGQTITHTFDVFLVQTDPVKINEEEIKKVYWADPKEVFEDMQNDSSDKYTGAFRKSLKTFLELK